MNALQKQQTSTAVATIESWIGPIASDFSASLSDDKINLASEAGFAVQIISSNSYAMGIAQKNSQSLRNAVINVAALGVSLNPAEKKAYLVPRGGAICLDISYRGLAQIAVDSGAAEWVEAKVVYSNDDYQPQGIGKMPLHRPANPFNGSKGDIVGVYAVAKRPDGSYCVRELDMQRINAIKARSESAKRGGGPWATDYEEMILKTGLKAVVKQLQGTSKRIDAAIELLNQHEGIDFKSEEKRTMRDINASQDVQARVVALVDDNGLAWDAFAAGPIVSIIGHAVESVEELSMVEAGQVIAMLEMRLQKVRKNGGVQ